MSGLLTWCLFPGIIDQKLEKTRLHSSRMRTARALTVSPSILCAGGVPVLGVYLVPGGVPGLGGCLLLGVFLVWGEVSALGGVPGPRGVPDSGGCTWSGTPPCEQTGL